MNSSRRVMITLSHTEPDMVPLDLGATLTTGMERTFYKNLLAYLGIEDIPATLRLRANQAKVGDALRDKLNVDVYGVFPPSLENPQQVLSYDDNGKPAEYLDGFRTIWHKATSSDYYYVSRHPLSNEVDSGVRDSFYQWPDPSDPALYEGLTELCELYAAQGKFIILGASMTCGIFGKAPRLCGYEQFLMDLVRVPGKAAELMDRLVDLEIAFYEQVFERLGQRISVVTQYDDLGTQDRLMISPETYRRLVRPRHKRLFEFIKKTSHGNAKIFLHSDGAIAEIIDDLIAVGVDILNPLQFTASGMNSRELKRRFGDSIVFWGGGIDTQTTLPRGTPDQIRAEVTRQVETLAPGGGYVFSPVHNVQADVPVENFMAMWEAFMKIRTYT